MCWQVVGVFLCRLEFLASEIRSKVDKIWRRSGQRHTIHFHFGAVGKRYDRVNRATEVGFMGLRAHSTPLPAAADLLEGWEKNTVRRRGTVAASLLQQHHPSCPRLALSKILQTPSINGASSAAISGQLTPCHRALKGTHVGGLEPLFGALAAPRQGEAKLDAKLQCVLLQV